MQVEIRAAALPDLPQMVELLMQEAGSRESHDPALWALAHDAREKVAWTVKFALTADKQQPFPQKWLVAASEGALVGIVHTMRLPVPPIYAGRWGDPGLLMPECFAAQDAPPGTMDALIGAAETDLREAGVKLLLATFVAGDERRSCLVARGYEPITLYLAKTGIEVGEAAAVRPASEADIPGIVERSAEHRAVLAELDEFWTLHPEADGRFGNWMKRSLTLNDRDMRVVGPPDDLGGYVIAQPGSRLHFPPAHDIAAIGTIDDYFHRDFSDPATLVDGGDRATALLRSAEAAFIARGIKAAFVVCPAAWTSKISLLENAGYKTAMFWMIKR